MIQRMTRRSVLRGGLAIAALPVLVACGAAATPTTAPQSTASGGQQQQPAATPTTAAAATPAEKPASTPAAKPSPATTGETVQLTFVANHAVAQGRVVEEAVKAFNSANPNIQVLWVNTPDGYAQRLQTLVAGGQPPDMFRLGGPEFASYVYRGFMLGLDDYMNRDKFDRDDYWPIALESYVWDGKQFGVGDNVGNRLVYYNLNLWEEASLERPPADWGPDGWTFDDIVETGKALTKTEGNRVTQFGIVNVMDWTTWVLANGGSLWNEEATEAKIHEPEAIEAFQFLQDLMFTHNVAQTKEMATELTPSQAFMTGKSGMAISSTATGTTTYRQINAFNWDAAPMPRGPSLEGARRVFGGGSGMFIFRTTKHPEEAWQLFKHMTDPEVARLLAKEGFAPPRLSIVNSPEWLDPSLPPASRKVVTEGPNHIVPHPKSTTWAEWVNTVNAELDALWTNKMKAADLAARLKEVAVPLEQKHLENVKNAPKF